MAETIEEVYSRFGRDVVREVERRYDEDGSLAPILQKLGVPAMPGLHNQHRALTEFLYRYGVFIFLQASQTDITAEEINKLKMQKLMGTPMLGAAAPAAPQPQPAKKKPAPAPATVAPPAERRAASEPNANAVNMPVRVVDAMPRAKPAQADAGGTKDRKLITSEDYTGPDRRSGKERRGKGRPRRAKQERVWLDRRRKRSADRRTTARRAEDRAAASGALKNAPERRRER